ncbi:MAG: transposase [Clostridia bacterium]|nr:transposase [Clostridia bacterium]
MAEQKKYDKEYKVEAVKLAREIGRKKASEELGVPIGTLYGWVRQAADGSLDMGKGNRTPDDALNLAQEVQALRKKIKTLERENKRLTEENELLADASAFFAASRRKSGKTSE